MVLFLLRRDDSLKVALVCVFLAPLVLLSSRGSGALGFLQAVAFVVLMSAFQLRLDRRASRLEVALPISGRQLYLVRVAGRLSMVWLPVISACVVLMLVRRSAGRPLAMQLAQGGAVLTLAALLPLSTWLQEAAVAGGVSLALSAAVLATGAATWLFLPPQVHLLVFAAATASVFLWSYGKVPPSFQLSPMDAVEQRRSVGRRLRRPAWWPMWRSAYPWLAFVLFAYGILTGLVLVMAVAPTVFVFQAGFLSRNGTRWLHSLPLSHRTLLALTLSTTVIPFMTGAVIGRWSVRPSFVTDYFGPFRPSVGGVGPYASRDSRFSYSDTNVPLEYWRRAPGGNVPVIRAPWGETVHPLPVSILGMTFYNPYAAAYNPWWTQRGNTSANRNSERFFEWQYENATQRLYGRRITFSQYYDAVERASAGSRPGEPTVRQTLQTMRQAHRLLSIIDDPGKTRVDILTLATILFWLLAGAFLRELALWHSLKRGVFFARCLLFLTALPLIAQLWFDLFFQFRNGTPVLVPLTRLLFQSVSAMLPQNLVALTVIAALPSLGMYWLLERQFAHSEMTGPIAWRVRSDIS